MTTVEGNTEAGFLFATLTEFIHLWKSGKEGTLSLKCKDGKTSVKFQGSLGHPDTPHIQDGRRGKKRRVKSEIRKARDNARAAAFQAAGAPPPTAAPPAPTPAGQDQDVPAPVPPALPPAGQDRDKSPPHTSIPGAQSHQLTTPSPSPQPPPRHTSPLPTLSPPSSLPSSSGERSQEKKAARVGRRMKRATRVETRSGTRSVRFREEAGEKETTEFVPRGAEKVTEEEVTSSQSRPSSHQDRQAVEQKEEKKEDDGVMTPAFWERCKAWEHQVELQDKLLRSIQKRRALSEAVKPDKPPDEDHPPPLKRN